MVDDRGVAVLSSDPGAGPLAPGPGRGGSVLETAAFDLVDGGLVLHVATQAYAHDRRPFYVQAAISDRAAALFVGVIVAQRPSEIRVAVTGAGGSGVFRVTSFEEALKKRFSPKSIDGLTVPADGLAGDIHGSSEYRAHLIGVCAKRALEAADK